MTPTTLGLARILALLPILAAPVHAVDEIGADDFRISAMGGTGNLQYEATWPAVAYNAIDDEYLVVWAADSDQAPFGDGLWGIFGQRFDATTGAAVGADDFAISGVIDGLGVAGPYKPAIVHNPQVDEYLVVWVGNTGQCCGQDYEVFARRVAADGTLASAAVQVSQMRSASDFHNFDAFDPAVAFNPTAGEYLVVWSGDDGEGGLVDEEFEIFGQRLSAAGAPVGADDFRISAMGGTGTGQFDAGRPAIAYNPLDDEYLVVWDADDDAPPLVNDELEIHAQRLDGSTGAELGADDFRISSIGPDGDANYLVIEPAVAFDSLRRQYLVVWTAPEHAPALFTWAFEIYAQRLDASGAEIGADDFRITDVGPAGDTGFDAQKPEVLFHPVTGVFQVCFYANDDVGGQVQEEIEIFVQELDGRGVEIGPNDDRVSDVGPNGSPVYGAIYPAIAANAGNGQSLVVWRGDDDSGGLIDAEYEIFGQRLRSSGIFADGFESGDTGRWSVVLP